MGNKTKNGKSNHQIMHGNKAIKRRYITELLKLYQIMTKADTDSTDLKHKQINSGCNQSRNRL